FLHLVLGVERTAPDFRAVLQMEAVQRPIGAEGVDAPVSHQRRRARTIALAEVVPVAGVVTGLPVLLTRGRVEALDHFLIADAVEDDQLAAGHHWAAVARADVLFPQHGWPLFRPRLCQAGLGGGAVAVRPQELRPVRAAGCTTKTQRAPRREDGKEEKAPAESPSRSRHDSVLLYFLSSLRS